MWANFLDTEYTTNSLKIIRLNFAVVTNNSLRIFQAQQVCLVFLFSKFSKLFQCPCRRIIFIIKFPTTVLERVNIFDENWLVINNGNFELCSTTRCNTAFRCRKVFLDRNAKLKCLILGNSIKDKNIRRGDFTIFLSISLESSSWSAP